MKKPHFKHERTLVVVKPDGVQRGLIGEIIKRFEAIGLKLVAIKMVIPDKNFVEKHYTLDPLWIEKTGLKSIKGYKDKGLKPLSDDPVKVGKITLKKLIDYVTSGPVVAMVWQGAHAVDIVRKLTGGTEPLTSTVGTIRGDLMIDSYMMADEDNRAVRNVIHSSGSVKEASDEIALWFDSKELINYNIVHESIMYNATLDGILND